ncbi:hypothetical protein MMC17_004930 [Xylographa soralifera]|nr:hypothetical protein [Xylographa soralifera]
MPLASEYLRDFDCLPSSFQPRTIPVIPVPQALPSDIFDRFPHQLDMSIPFTEEVDTSDIRLADGVVTFLNMYSPSFMVQFFDLGNPAEFFCRKTKDLYESTELIIKRNTNVVTVGWCTVMMTDREMINGVLRKARLFRDYETIVKFCIQNAGDWTPMSAQDEMTDHEWNHDPNMVELVGAKAARMLLMRKEWRHGEGVTIKTSTDDPFEQTSDLFQQTREPFQRTSAIFRQAQQTGKTFQLNTASDNPIAGQKSRNPRVKGADQFTKTSPEEHSVKSRARAFVNLFTGNKGTKKHTTLPKATKRKTTAAPGVVPHPMDDMDSLVFQTNALNVEDANGHAIEDSSVQAHGAKGPTAKVQVIEGQVVDKASMENHFLQAWDTQSKSAKPQAMGNKVTNASADDGHIVKDPIIARPIRKSSKTNPDNIEEYGMMDLGRTV